MKQKPQPLGCGCYHDVPNENIIEFDIEKDELTDDDLRANKILMRWAQASAIRKAKALPMPCPLVDVVVADDRYNQVE